MNPNDPALRSFIPVAADSDFPIQNLPFGIFSTPDNQVPRTGVAIGDWVLDCAALEQAGLLRGGAQAVFNQPTLNAFIATGKANWRSTREAISSLLRDDQPLAVAERVLASNPGFGVGRYQGDAVQVAPHFALTDAHGAG